VTFINFAASNLTSIHQLPVPLLPLSFIPTLITVIIPTRNSCARLGWPSRQLLSAC